MNRQRISWKIAAIILVALVLTFIDLPDSTQKRIFPPTPNGVLEQKIRLGLDLQGGSQLDYKVDLRKVPEADKKNIVDGVVEVITKRVNGLGVAEPNIFTSSVGDEQHIIVELPGVKDLEEAKNIVGKTIQLEFKEKKDQLDPEETKKVEAMANTTLEKIKGGADFVLVGQEEQQANPGKVTYEEKDFIFMNKLPTAVQDTVKKLKVGEVAKTLINVGGTFSFDAETGATIEETSLDIIKLLDQKEEVQYKKQLYVSHMVIAYQGAQKADAGIIRTKEEAKKRAEDALAKVKAGGDFGALVKEYSDEPGVKDTAGKLPDPVNDDDQYADAFSSAALKLENAGDLTQELVETPFGFHIIRADKVETDIKATQLKVADISYSTIPDTYKETGLNGEHFKHADVQFDDLFQPYISITFDEEGAKMFEEITGRNVGKPLAIYVGGIEISAPRVNGKIAGGEAQITGHFTPDKAKELARDLNTGAIPAPILLAGQYTIGATLGQDALNKSMAAGGIGLLAVILFMILYYRLPGLLASAALGIYAVMLLFMIKSALPVWLAVSIAVLIFGAIINSIIKSDDPGWEKTLSFILSIIAFIFITFVFTTPIVLTLAGVAGVILSIGMAVDANILIFERIKEELRDGVPLISAIETGFARAWSSIRDSNFSSLITCAILFYFGTSIIKGFAFNLAAGILVSMFTAITITKTFLIGIAKTRLATKLHLFGYEKKKDKQDYKIIEKSKWWFGISAIPIVLSIVGILAFGFKLGLDFTGGTLMQFNFEKNVTQEEIKTSFGTFEDTYNTAHTDDKIDLKTAQVLTSGDKSYIIKTKFVNNDVHDLLIKSLSEKLGTFEEIRFTTVGPTVGETLKNKAIFAVAVAAFMIILYIAFAFRRIPKHIGPWRFGIAAVVALFHDVFITIGLFVFLGAYVHVELDALFITALLTVMGFSVHDTIVVFDRIRENIARKTSGQTLVQIANKALTETMARSINTSLSTMITLAALLFFGSPEIFYFILALFFGIFVGTYSSIFIASPLLVTWANWAEGQKKTE